MKIPFTKMHGLGNDFVLIDARELEIHAMEKFARTVCERRLGVGADQLLLMRTAAGDADVRMDIYNHDGSRVEMCGNGVRAFALFAGALGYGDPLRVETDGGVVTPRRLSNGHVEVDMGVPQFPGEVIDQTRTLGGGEWKITQVTVGNPHCVIFTETVAQVALEMVGPKIETDPYFPQRTNVEFVEVRAPDHLAVRVWERGAGATLACGSGACAALVAAARTGRSVRSAQVQLPGGALQVQWREDDHVYQSGPTETVFTGTYEW